MPLRIRLNGRGRGYLAQHTCSLAVSRLPAALIAEERVAGARSYGLMVTIRLPARWQHKKARDKRGTRHEHHADDSGFTRFMPSGRFNGTTHHSAQIFNPNASAFINT